jgi:hypothetical protein
MINPKLEAVHTRLFADDLAELRRRAALRRIGWQVELRLLVHRALKEAAVDLLEITVPARKK